MSIHISLITLNRDLARRIEPRAPTPEARIRALARLREAGIDAGINCMPVLPGITDNPCDLEALVKRVSEAGATYVGACALRLQSSARERYMPFISAEFPHLASGTGIRMRMAMTQERSTAQGSLRSSTVYA